MVPAAPLDWPIVSFICDDVQLGAAASAGELESSVAPPSSAAAAMVDLRTRMDTPSSS